MKKSIVPASIGSLLAGCAHVPDAIVHYPFARTEALISVARTLSCDGEKYLPSVATTTAVTTSNRADLSSPQGELKFRRLNSPLANTALELHFTEDGRLASINTESTGQGEVIIKSALGLIGSLAGLGGGGKESAPMTKAAPEPVVPQTEVGRQCKDFRDRFGDKSLTLTYAETIGFEKRGVSIPIKATADSAEDVQRYKALLGTLSAKVTDGVVVTKSDDKPLGSVGNTDPIPTAPETRPLTKPFELADQGRFSGALLDARQPAPMTLTVDFAPSVADEKSGPIWRGVIPVSQLGSKYEIPIPAAAVFGKQTFKASFADNGALTMIGYSSDSGTKSALDSAQMAVDAIKPKGDSAITKELNDAADLVAAQHRLQQCRDDPANCK